MTDNKWIYSIVPQEQVDEINTIADRIAFNHGLTVQLTMATTMDAAKALCVAWQLSAAGEPIAQAYLETFLKSLIVSLEEYLRDEGQDPYGSN